MKGSGKMFETGEYVVYGRTGICQVTGVTTMKMDGSSSERLYYILRPGGETEGKIFTPVEGISSISFSASSFVMIPRRTAYPQGC